MHTNACALAACCATRERQHTSGPPVCPAPPWQVEGLVCDRGLTLGDLIGTLREFFARLGLTRLRFKPAYNPYTETSMEIFRCGWPRLRPPCLCSSGLACRPHMPGRALCPAAHWASSTPSPIPPPRSYSEELGKWMEVGNSGMFRPEMLEPMGLPPDVRVIAWGLSLERPTMILYKIGNIRDLFGHKVRAAARAAASPSPLGRARGGAPSACHWATAPLACWACPRMPNRVASGRLIADAATRPFSPPPQRPRACVWDAGGPGDRAQQPHLPSWLVKRCAAVHPAAATACALVLSCGAAAAHCCCPLHKCLPGGYCYALCRLMGVAD